MILINIIPHRLSMVSESRNLFNQMLHASQIRAARALLGWSQEQLADAADIGVATIRRIEVLEGW